MRYIVPTTITDSMLGDSSLPEDDHTAWSAGAAYVVGNRVIRSATHSIYERLVDGTTATPPEDDAVNWLRVGPTNRWAAFDGAVGTKSVADDVITMSLMPGMVQGLALLDLDIEAATITMQAGGVTVYLNEIEPIQTQEDCDSWYDYFFEAVQRRSAVILTDLPPYTDGVITIELRGAGSAVSVGSCVVGPVYELGDVVLYTALVVWALTLL